jgi:hypothetical protein
MGMRKLSSISILGLVLLLTSLVVWAQQPQTTTAPIYAVNAKYVNGVAPGYWSTPGSGLTLNISAGTVFCLGTVRTYSSGTLTMANNTTNYVYLDTTSLCVPATSTSTFNGTTIPLAVVVTSGGVITSVTDDRTTMSTSIGTASIVGGTCTNQAVTAINTSSVPTCTTLTSAYVNNSIALTGTDINTSNQVTATHLSAALPINQGGTATTSTLTGVVRGGNPLTASELSGDATTSGSNAVTVVKVNGLSIPVSANYLRTNGSGQFVAGDYPETKIIPSANCPNAVAGAGWSYATSTWTVACRGGTNNIGGALQLAPSSGGAAQFRLEIPADWDSASQPYIRIEYGSGANTSGTVIWTVASACTKADGSVTDDPSFNAESAFGTQTMAAANRAWSQTGQFTAITSGNNCVGGGAVIIKMTLSGTASSAINAYQAIVTTQRLPVVQAN